MPKEPGYARERIIAGAAALLAETGYEGFSLRKLGAHLGLTASAIYIHFADKDELLRAVLDREFAAAAPAFFAANQLPPDANARQRLDRLIHFYLAMGLGNPEHYRIRFFHDRGADAQIQAWSRGEFAPDDNARVLRDALEAWLAERPPLPAERRRIAFLELWSLLHGLILSLAPADLPAETKLAAAHDAARRFLEAFHA